MKIGIIGSGNMGAGLGKLWAKAGHQIIFSYSRDENKLHELAGKTSRCHFSSRLWLRSCRCWKPFASPHFRNLSHCLGAICCFEPAISKSWPQSTKTLRYGSQQQKFSSLYNLRLFDPHRLDIHKLVDSLNAQFSSITRSLDATKRETGI